MKKRFFAAFLALCMLLTILPVAALADGQYGGGGDLSYTIRGGTLTIRADGSIWDFEEGQAPWAEYADKIRNVVIEESTTGIGDYLFCGELNSITIPASVETISETAFSGLSVETIVVSADSKSFSSADGLLYSKDGTELLRCPGGRTGEVAIPAGVKKIGAGAFDGCSKLTAVTIPAGVTAINDNTFRNCTGLAEVEIPAGVTSIGTSAFEGCSALRVVEIPEGVRSIGYFAFDSCSSLISAVVPGSVTEIGVRVFRGCSSLVRVAIPKTVTALPDGVFYGCESLTDVYYAGTEKQWKEITVADRNEPLKTAAMHYNESVKPGDDRFMSPFDDVQDSTAYYYKPVLWAVDQGITTGKTTAAFAPDETCTRAQVVAFLYRAAGEPEVDAEVKLPFTDVTKDDYYYNAVIWGYKEGIVTGKTSKTFGPDAKISRADFVTFLYRFADEPKLTDQTCAFEDVPAGKYYTNAVIWAAQNKITTGKTTKAFAPTEPCTRGQVMTFLYRYLGDHEAE